MGINPNPYQLKLAVFEGPFDLLLYLIKKNQIDIYDIPIAKITQEYLEYIELMRKLNLNVASEFIVIASTLLLAAAVFQISDSLQVITLGALRGLQDVKIPTLITFIAYWIIGFPISYFLGKPEALGSLGIWIGLVAGLTSAAIMLFLRFRYLTLRLIESSNN